MYQNFIGIDIGKNDFFVALYGQKKVKQYQNNKNGFKLFSQTFAQHLKHSLVVLETTGGYERALIDYLQADKIDVHRANTRKVKSFVRSHGKIGKSDEIDAAQLALYGFERHKILPLFQAYEDEDLQHLVKRRRELKQMLAQEKNRKQAPSQKSLMRSINTIIQALKDEIDIINQAIKTCCAQKEGFSKKVEVIKTVAGIGDITAVDLLASMPELGKLNRKQIASLGNLAPHPNESGKKVGYRRTRGGRENIKPILFMSAMAASRTKTREGEFYNKLLANGKKKMVALTALMRKILVIANARMRDYYEETMANEQMLRSSNLPAQLIE